MQIWIILLALAIWFPLTASAQDCPQNHLISLAKQFPTFDQLEMTLRDNYDVTRRVLALQDKMKEGAPLVGPRALGDYLRNAFTVKLDARFSRTLQSTRNQDDTLTPLRLTQVQFVPAYSVAFEINLGKLLDAASRRSAGEELEKGQAFAYNSERSKLLKLYAEFDLARYVFGNGVQGENFYKMKIKAIETLAQANYNFHVISCWVNTEFQSQPTDK